LYGDDCLKEIAKAISKATQRRTDLAARYGGDELIVILYNSSLRDTENFAKNLQKSIRSLAIRNDHSPISDQLTVTIGISNMIPAMMMI